MPSARSAASHSHLPDRSAPINAGRWLPTMASGRYAHPTVDIWWVGLVGFCRSLLVLPGRGRIVYAAMANPLPPVGEELLATALDLFTSRGISAVGIQELTETAGHTRDSLYRIFKSKTGLVLATLDRYKEELPWLEFLQS